MDRSRLMPRAFRFPNGPSVMPLGAAPPAMQRILKQRNNHSDSRVIARLAVASQWNKPRRA